MTIKVWKTFTNTCAAAKPSAGNEDVSPIEVPAISIHIPKNKSTGNLLSKQYAATAGPEGRTRFSFDAGSIQEINNLKRWANMPAKIAASKRSATYTS